MAGYSQFATLLTRFPECQMFRKFDRLTVLMLLYLQAELVYLEQELEMLADFDSKREETKDIGKCWEHMRVAFQNGNALVQKDKIQEIQKKLNAYHELLLQAMQIHRLGKPAVYSHKLVSEWLTSSKGGNNFLDVYEATPWQTDYKPDLVSLVEPANGLDQRLAQYLTPIYHVFGRFRKPDTDTELGIGEIWEYKLSGFVKLGNLCCIILSCAVPLGSVFALFFVTNVLDRLLLIAAFTIAFTSILGFASGCRRSEIFAATAAFVAVQVVFLQGVMSIHPTG